MGIGKKITFADLLQLLLIHLKLTEQINWHWLTIVIPFVMSWTYAIALYVTKNEDEEF